MVSELALNLTTVALSGIFGLSSSEIDDASTSVSFPFAIFYTWLNQNEVKNIGVFKTSTSQVVYTTHCSLMSDSKILNIKINLNV